MEPISDKNLARAILETLGFDRVRIAIFGDGPPSAKSGEKPGEKALRQAAWSGSLSPLHFGAIEQLCIEDGIPCPREAFSFKYAPKDAA